MTQEGLFSPTRVPQGVTDATPYYQGIMMEVLSDLVGRGCLIYVDDMKRFGRTVAELVADLREALLRFMERDLFLAAQKFVLFASEV